MGDQYLQGAAACPAGAASQLGRCGLGKAEREAQTVPTQAGAHCFGTWGNLEVGPINPLLKRTQPDVGKGGS